MIMRRGQPLLLPASPLFIWGSLFTALVLNFVQNISLWGRGAWAPDLLALVLVFWTVHVPQRISIGAAFFFGLCMDVHYTSLLGQHALSYTVLSFVAIVIHRRVLWLPVPSQAIHVLPSGGAFPGWDMLIAPLIEAALWPVVSVFLLLPQQRAVDPDKNRPLL
jgi:rod shape-determining protein MreD